MRKFLLLSIFSLLIFFASAQQGGNNPGLQNQQRGYVAEQNELRIYPNPTETGQVTLEMNSGEISEIRLINITGKEVITQKIDFGSQKHVLSLENLPNGIYFVRVHSTDNKTVVKKLVISSR